MKLFDTHCHIALLYRDSIEQIRVIDDARRAGVVAIANISTNLADFEAAYKNTKHLKNVFHTVGISPSEVDNPGKEWEQTLKNYCKFDKVIGVGEIGLDYFHKYGDRNKQIELFIRQLEIAGAFSLPVVIHNREAGDDMKSILRSKISSSGGIMHCFSENTAFAYDMIDLGLYISFAGNLTYRNAKNLHEVARNIPLENILIETDSPFLTPHTYRSKRNQPAYLVETAKYLAEIKGITEEQVSEQLLINSIKVFRVTLDE